MGRSGESGAADVPGTAGAGLTGRSSPAGRFGRLSSLEDKMNLL
jgi:hypothetical protein